MALDRGFTVDRNGVVRGPGEDGKEIQAAAAYLVGGRHREDLLVRMPDGRLQVFPFSFDLDRKKAFEPLRELAGGVPPPTDTVDFWTRFGRNADFTCYGCHATGQTIAVAGGNAAGNAVPRSRWSEAGVGCEGCHGPSGPHVESARKKTDPPAPPPWTGKGESADSIVAACATCHGLRELLRSPYQTSTVAGHGAPVWESADPVLSFRPNAEFRQPFFADLRPGTYQQEAIALGQSACVRKGGLTCSHCHDPHSGTIADSARGDAACLPCHQKIVSAAVEHSHHKAGSPGSAGVDCHMAPVLRGPGSEGSADHSLSPPLAERGQLPAACSRCHDRKVDEKKVRASWLAFGGRAKETVRRGALAGAIRDADRQAPGAVRTIASLLRDADQGWFVRYALASRLQGLLLLEPGKDAAPALLAALPDPNPAVRRAVLRALAIAGRRQDAASIQLRMSDPDPFVAIEAATALVGLRDPQAAQRLVSFVTRPELAGEFRAQLALGRAALLTRSWARAEQTFARAIELNPSLAPAMNDLGIALFSQKKIEAAQRVWKQALDFNPQFEAARRNLDESEGIERAP
jgi:hypothetical protein